MDATAIKEIMAAAVAGKQLPPALADSEGTHIAYLVPDGMSMQSLERFRPQPDRQRVKFDTRHIEDFVAYVGNEMTEKTAVFITSDGSGATSYIDFGSHAEPAWREHIAALSLKDAPEYAACRSASERAKSQSALADWLEDWGHAITRIANSSGEPLTLTEAIAGVRKVDIKATSSRSSEDGDFKAARSSFDEVEAAADQLPARITIRSTVMDDDVLPERDIVLRLSLRTGGEKPAFVLAVVQHEMLRRDVALDVQRLIREKLEGKIGRVFIGSA